MTTASHNGTQPGAAPAAAGGPLLQVRGLHKDFTSGWMRRRQVVRAVRDVSFEVGAGQATGLVGESGSGKSTVARLIARLEQPTAGQILLDGQDVIAAEPRHASRGYRHQVQMIFQDPFSSLNPTHTVGYHLRRALQIHGTAAAGRCRPGPSPRCWATSGWRPCPASPSAIRTSCPAGNGSGWPSRACSRPGRG